MTVPDAFTPLTIVPVTAGTFPWLGTDQKYHVDYDLQLTNEATNSATPTMMALTMIAELYPDQVR